jgi:hypothetical protein
MKALSQDLYKRHLKDYREIHYKEVRKTKKARKARKLLKATTITKCKDKEAITNRIIMYLQLIIIILHNYLTVIVDSLNEQLINIYKHNKPIIKQPTTINK